MSRAPATWTTAHRDVGIVTEPSRRNGRAVDSDRIATANDKAFGSRGTQHKSAVAPNERARNNLTGVADSTRQARMVQHGTVDN